MQRRARLRDPPEPKLSALSDCVAENSQTTRVAFKRLDVGDNVDCFQSFSGGLILGEQHVRTRATWADNRPT